MDGTDFFSDLPSEEEKKKKEEQEGKEGEGEKPKPLSQEEQKKIQDLKMANKFEEREYDRLKKEQEEKLRETRKKIKEAKKELKNEGNEGADGSADSSADSSSSSPKIPEEVLKEEVSAQVSKALEEKRQAEHDQLVMEKIKKESATREEAMRAYEAYKSFPKTFGQPEMDASFAMEWSKKRREMDRGFIQPSISSGGVDIDSGSREPLEGFTPEGLKFLKENGLSNEEIRRISKGGGMDFSKGGFKKASVI